MLEAFLKCLELKTAMQKFQCMFLYRDDADPHQRFSTKDLTSANKDVHESTQDDLIILKQKWSIKCQRISYIILYKNFYIVVSKILKVFTVCSADS